MKYTDMRDEPGAYNLGIPVKAKKGEYGMVDVETNLGFVLHFDKDEIKRWDAIISELEASP